MYNDDYHDDSWCYEDDDISPSLYNFHPSILLISTTSSLSSSSSSSSPLYNTHLSGICLLKTCFELLYSSDPKIQVSSYTILHQFITYSMSSQLTQLLCNNILYAIEQLHNNNIIINNSNMGQNNPFISGSHHQQSSSSSSPSLSASPSSSSSSLSLNSSHVSLLLASMELLKIIIIKLPIEKVNISSDVLNLLFHVVEVAVSRYYNMVCDKKYDTSTASHISIILSTVETLSEFMSRKYLPTYHNTNYNHHDHYQQQQQHNNMMSNSSVEMLNVILSKSVTLLQLLIQLVQCLKESLEIQVSSSSSSSWSSTSSSWSYHHYHHHHHHHH